MNFSKILKNIKNKMGWKDIDKEFECFNDSKDYHNEFLIDAEEYLLEENIKNNRKHYLNPNSRAFVHKIKKVMKKH